VQAPDKKRIRILKVDVITGEKFVNLHKMHYRDRNGHEKTWSYASRCNPAKAESGSFDTPDAVVIVAFHEHLEKLVLIREFRIPLANYLYGFPAGLLDEGESIEDCARRELFEETGLHLTRVRKISPPIYSSSGLSDESVVMVYGDCTGDVSDLSTGDAEDIEVLFVSPLEARDLCTRHDIMFDVKTWLVLETFAGAGKI
jgi:ADP-ribose pyrophosphatase